MSQFDKVLPALRVTDMEESVDFYSGVLGFQVGERDFGWQRPVRNHAALRRAGRV